MRHMIGGHLEGWVGDWLKEVWVDVLEINWRETEAFEGDIRRHWQGKQGDMWSETRGRRHMET